jgi:hypothetical protein
MTDRTPHTESDLVLVDVKAKPSGWPPASLDPDSGELPRQSAGGRPTTQTTILKSLRFQGIARLCREWWFWPDAPG